jgi:S1-C subfamily serine protease
MSQNHRTRALRFLAALRTTLIAGAATTIALDAAWAIPQTQSGGGTGTSRVARARCSQCSSERDSLRRTQEALLVKIDSLRWEIENRRLTSTERDAVAREMTRTIIALEATRLESMREARELGAAEAAGQAVAARRSSPSVAVAVQTGYRMRGYLGVTFDGPMAETTRPGNERIVRFYQYPHIALVEASSPAERAGVRAGDTLVALNGDDVREHEFSFTRLLVPNAFVTMRVRRDGNPRDVKVQVGEAPEYYVRRAPLPPPVAVAPAVPRGSSPSEVQVFTVPPTPSASVQGQSYIYSFSDGVAGARVETITDGLAKAIRVDDGVLVVRVGPGTPAERSGLRDGDVIKRAGGRAVTTVRALRSAVADAEGDRGVKLLIIREGRERALTLHW